MTEHPSNGLTAVLAQQALARARLSEFAHWWTAAERIGFCTHPVRLAGRGPAGDRRAVLTRCRNRRAAVCPSCSEQYAADTWHLVYAGAAGGHGVPEAVASHPMVFATLTAPTFGAVHRIGDTRSPRCRLRRRTDATCPHGRSMSCRTIHPSNDSEVGQPLCPDCYDYSAHVLFTWHAPDLWHRFVVKLRRQVAQRVRARGGDPNKVRLSYVKVVEMQRRGVPHIHTLIRLDGPSVRDEAVTAPTASLAAHDLAALVVSAAGDVRLTVPGRGGSSVILRFGEQLDTRPFVPQVAEGVEHVATDGRRVAGYLAKYVTKSVADVGLSPRRLSIAAIDTLDVTPHVRTILWSIAGLAEEPGRAEMARWLHTLGYRGHTTTKTRHYSTTMTALREERHDWQRAAVGDDAVPISWRFVGNGYATDGHRQLALAAARSAREVQRSHGIDGA